MAKRKQQQPELIEEIESGAERLATWIGENAWAVGITLVVLLGAALTWGIYNSWEDRRETTASNELDAVQSEYYAALGAGPLARTEPELANPEAANEIRAEYLGRFLAVADAHQGTVAGTLALFDAAQIQTRLDREGDPDDTPWRRALAATEGNPGLHGLVQQRIAAAHEDRGDWAEAARAHEAAGGIAGYPLRYWALVDAARCWAASGDNTKALELYERVEVAEPDLPLPQHLKVQRGELKASQPAAAAAASS